MPSVETPYSLSPYALLLKYRRLLFRRKALPIMIQRDVVTAAGESFITDGYGFEARGARVPAHGQNSRIWVRTRDTARPIQISAGLAPFFTTPFSKSASKLAKCVTVPLPCSKTAQVFRFPSLTRDHPICGSKTAGTGLIKRTSSAPWTSGIDPHVHP